MDISSAYLIARTVLDTTTYWNQNDQNWYTIEWATIFSIRDVDKVEAVGTMPPGGYWVRLKDLGGW